jgi:hypothetical protein
MLNVSSVLDKNHIRRTNVVFAVADTSVLVSEAADPLYTASKLFFDVLGVEIKFTDAVYARMAAKKMIEIVIKDECMIESEVENAIITAFAVEYAETFVADPANSYLWSKSDEQAQPVQVVEGLDCNVALTTTGKIKRGGKKTLAIELYDKYVVKADPPANRKEFIALLVDKLELTIPAASTYHYNLKSGQEGWAI